MNVSKLAPPLIAFAAGFLGIFYWLSKGQFPKTFSNPFGRFDSSTLTVHGRNGLSTGFKSNITNEELDAHCLNIELMRQRLRGMRSFKFSSQIQGTSRIYESYFPATVNEKDLDEYLDIAADMRRRIQAKARQS
ncbi:MAG: hypothetical protein Q9220_000511 [cf. Caloplaca sp. 1 TL-2023]